MIEWGVYNKQKDVNKIYQRVCIHFILEYTLNIEAIVNTIEYAFYWIFMFYFQINKCFGIKPHDAVASKNLLKLVINLPIVNENCDRISYKAL